MVYRGRHKASGNRLRGCLVIFVFAALLAVFVLIIAQAVATHGPVGP